MHPIKKFCIDKGITLKKLSTDIGISAPYMTEIVKGRKCPSLVIALEFEKKTGGAVTSRDLLIYKHKKSSLPSASRRRQTER